MLNSLKNAIVSGQLEPGDRLPPMTELATSMGVGVSSVREAVKMLEALNVLETKHGEGTFVCSDSSSSTINPLSLQLILLPRLPRQLVEFREIYETAYVMLAMKNATAEDLQTVEAEVLALEQEVEFREPDSDDEMAFHGAVLRCTHNVYIIKTGEALLDLFQSTIPKIGGVADKYSIVRDHRRIYEALKNKDIEDMNKVLKKSFDGWGIRLDGKPFVEEEADGKLQIDREKE